MIAEDESPAIHSQLNRVFCASAGIVGGPPLKAQMAVQTEISPTHSAPSCSQCGMQMLIVRISRVADLYSANLSVSVVPAQDERGRLVSDGKSSDSRDGSRCVAQRVPSLVRTLITLCRTVRRVRLVVLLPYCF
jgi:hypothetical protein